MAIAITAVARTEIRARASSLAEAARSSRIEIPSDIDDLRICGGIFDRGVVWPAGIRTIISVGSVWFPWQ